MIPGTWTYASKAGQRSQFHLFSGRMVKLSAVNDQWHYLPLSGAATLQHWPYQSQVPFAGPVCAALIAHVIGAGSFLIEDI